MTTKDVNENNYSLSILPNLDLKLIEINITGKYFS